MLYDNLGRERAIDSASLAMALTSGTIADRVLGESTYSSVPFRALILLTGNNPRIAGDLNRRLLRAQITPDVENPWTRVFPFCPRARTEANWLTMRVAALELVRAARVDGPPSLVAGSGYPDWDFLVRATICWIARQLDIGVGFADPAQSLLVGYEEDPERDRLRRLVTPWHAAFGSEPRTVGQVLAAVSLEVLAPDTPNPREPHDEELSRLGEALSEFGRRPGESYAHAVGIYLNQQKGRIVDGLELVSCGKHAGSTRWVVRRVGAQGAAAQLSLPLVTMKEVA